MYVYVLSALVAPGVVNCYNAPTLGALDIGRYPTGSDSVAETITGQLRNAGFDSIVRPDIMRWKRGKLVTNMANAIGAACSTMDQLGDIAAGAREEAERCLAAAQLDYASAGEVRDRATAQETRLVEGSAFPGSSTVQSLARGAEATEVDYLSGEVARLGRTFGSRRRSMRACRGSYARCRGRVPHRAPSRRRSCEPGSKLCDRRLASPHPYDRGSFCRARVYHEQFESRCLPAR